MIRQRLNEELKSHPRSKPFIEYDEPYRLEAFSFRPIYSAFCEAGNTWPEFEIAARNLSKLLEASTHDTVDDFIIDYPSQSLLTRIGISAVLFGQLYSKADSKVHYRHTQFEGPKVDHFELRDLLARNFPKRVDGKVFRCRNWTHLLINIIRYSVRNNILEEKVRIINFNYDSVLEYVFEKLFHHTEAEYGSLDEYVEIIHPHGQFPRLSDTVADPAAEVLRWAESICVVQQIESSLPEHIKRARETAKNWVATSSRLYAAGFAFAGANCRLLGLNRNYGGPAALHYCNYDGNMGVRQSVERLRYRSSPTGILEERFNVIEASGSRANPISIEDWFSAGYAGEPPA